MSPTATTIEEDLTKVRQVQKMTRAYMAAMRKALPAARRLEKAGYHGAESLSCELDIRSSDGSTGTPAMIAESLEDFFRAGTDLGAFEFRTVERCEISLAEAEIQIRRCCNVPGHDDGRVEALLAYAARQNLPAEAATPIQTIEIETLKLQLVIATGGADASRLARDLFSRIDEIQPVIQAKWKELIAADSNAEWEISNYAARHEVDVLDDALKLVKRLLDPAVAIA